MLALGNYFAFSEKPCEPGIAGFYLSCVIEALSPNATTSDTLTVAVPL